MHIRNFWIFFLLSGSLFGAEFKAGMARVKITPGIPIWMSGYAARTRPAESILTDLWAKALVLEDSHQKRVILITTDLIGLPSSVTREVAEKLKERYGIQRAQLFINSSHTHSGPVVRPNLKVLYDLSPQDEQTVIRYTRQLTDQLVSVAGEAMKELRHVRLAYSETAASFGINRRELKTNGMTIGVNPSGPVDHTVPVVQVKEPGGKLLAVLFGYACHNTTLGGDSYSINGDYAGFAQIELEQRHPEAMAMFLILCGADQNPHPRGTVELAREYGKTLAGAVDKALSSKSTAIHPDLRPAYREVSLEFAPQSRTVFEEELKDQNKYRQRRARLMLEAFDRGQPVHNIQYPIQAWRLGKNVVLLGLGGEVVIDYQLRVKREFPRQNFFVAGYSNEVMAYIPSQRVLKEGGYEPVESMIYYGQPGPFREDVEEQVFQGIRQVLREVSVK